MKLILATHNKHKIDEIRDVLKDTGIEVESLLDYPEVVLPEETGETFEENSRVKARTVYEALIENMRKEGGMRRGEGGKNPREASSVFHPPSSFVLADDSGLCVDALGGRPGVYSSRYSGEPVDYDRNNKKLLTELKGVPTEKRGAHFICSMILLAPTGKEFCVEGKVSGFISESEAGCGGFGYDPVFYLPFYGKTIAEIPFEEKNKLSHRGLATKKVKDILVEVLSGAKI